MLQDTEMIVLKVKLHLVNSKTIPALIGYFSYQNLSFTSGWPNLAAANLIKPITQELN